MGSARRISATFGVACAVTACVASPGEGDPDDLDLEPSPESTAAPAPSGSFPFDIAHKVPIGLPASGVFPVAAKGPPDASIDEFLITVDANSPNWDDAFGSVNEDLVLGLANDSSSNVYATGTFQGSLALAGACGTLTSTADSSMFVAKYAAGTGTCVWATKVSGVTSADDTAGTAIALDSTGNVYVVGGYAGSLTTPLTTTSVGGYDIVITAYTGAGAFVWARSVGGTGDDLAYGVAVNALNIDVVGAFDAPSTFGGTTSLSVAGNSDAFFAAYTRVGGIFAHANAWGGPGYDAANGVAVDSLGNVWMTGAFSGTVDFGSGTPVASAGGMDAFLTSYSALGLFNQVTTYGGAGDDSGVALALDASNEPRVAGYFASSITIGTTLTGTSAAAGFVAGFSASGGAQWSRALGASGSAYGEAIAVDSSANVYVTGRYGGIGASDLSGLSAAGTTDVFLASYGTTGTPRWVREAGTSGATEGTALTMGSSGVVAGGSFSGVLNCGLGAATSAGMDDLFVCNLPSTTLVVGDSSVATTAYSIAKGSAEAFTFTASASGPVADLTLYLDSTSAASKVLVGVYSASGASPGTLLTSGTLASPAAGWNTVAVPSVNLASGTTYWLAILVPTTSSGSAVIRGTTLLGTTASASSSSAALTSLPVAWSTGTSGSTGPASIYGGN